MQRDGRCRFGNCTATRYLHAHHIDHWPASTVMGNLALLCWHHHHAVHEGGWTLTGNPNGPLHATNPTGTHTHTSHPHNWQPPGTHPPGAVGTHDTQAPGRPISGSRGADSPRQRTPDPTLTLFTDTS
jgi:hypothetical protein